MKLFIYVFFVSLIVVLFFVYRPASKEFFIDKETVHDCKTMLMNTLNMTEKQFQDTYEIDLASRIDIDNPVCKKYEKLNIGEVLLDMKADVLNVGPDGDEQNTNTCILPLEAIQKSYDIVTLKPSPDPNGNHRCLINAAGGDTIEYESNVLNMHSTNNLEDLINMKNIGKDDRVYWGCKLDPLDKTFNRSINELFYAKNRPLFQQLAVEANACFKLEEDRERFQHLLDIAELRKQEETQTMEKHKEENEQTQTRLKDQTIRTDEAIKKYTLRHSEHVSAREYYERVMTEIKNRQGLSFEFFEGYFADNLAHFENRRLVIKGIKTLVEYPRNVGVSLEMKGYFKPSKTGWWTFQYGTDDSGYMWIGQMVKTKQTTVDNAIIALPGIHGVITKSVTIHLQQGAMYPLRLVQGNHGGGATMIMKFSGPGVQPTSDGTGYYFTADF